MNYTLLSGGLAILIKILNFSAFTESADNSAKLDMEGLAVIGNNLLVFCAENKQWETGYQILRAMTHFHLEYLKYCGPYRHIALIAMETCLQFFQPESALQILKGRVNFCLFDLILYVPSTIFQLNRDGSSWVEPVLS